jgi:N-acetylmuramoyl-L-alanine amidase
VRCSKRSPPTFNLTLNLDTLRRGATGLRVRDLHERLVAFGLAPLADPVDKYDDGTVAAVEAFQRARGLPITGEVDAVTWTRLVEASWQLGQRLLYLTRPNQRGDDVAELQVRLAQLGFNPGRIDGIFGPVLEHALSDFQRNCGLAANGTLTRASLLELTRMTPIASVRNLVTDARDLAGFDDLGSGPLVLCGDSHLALLLESQISISIDVRRLEVGVVDAVASFANELSAAAVLSLQFLEGLNGIHLHYWASYRSHSRRGEQLASEIAAGLSRSQSLPRVEVTGMALPLLRETRMTTLHIEHGEQSDQELHELAVVIAQVLTEVFHREGQRHRAKGV